MPSDLGTLPGAEMSVEFAAKFKDFVLDALEFSFFPIAGGKAAQFLDVFLEAFDFFLALESGDGFFVFMRCAHQFTLWMPSSPQMR
jgi:hypothetical protein